MSCLYSILKLFQLPLFETKCNRFDVSTIIKMPYYAVARGRQSGVFMTWGECEAQVKGFSGARYKKFDSVETAENFIRAEGSVTVTQTKKNSSSYHNKFNNNASNLKRSYSTSSSYQSNKNNYLPTTKFNESETTASIDYDDSDDLNTIISKQMDDIEKRLKTFERGVDKIIKHSKPVLIDPPRPKKRKTTQIGNNQFEEDSDGFVTVYTDGACSANGKQGARAGIGVYWGDNHPLNISDPVSGRATNNCGEIQAATCAIKQALQNGVKKLTVYTDSKFLINSVTKWMPGWKRKGWKLKSGEPVKNETDFKDLDSVQNKLQIKWNYVEAHRGVHGNEMADKLARDGATKYKAK